MQLANQHFNAYHYLKGVHQLDSVRRGLQKKKWPGLEWLAYSEMKKKVWGLKWRKEGKCSYWLTVWEVEGKEEKNLVHLNLRGKGEWVWIAKLCLMIFLYKWQQTWLFRYARVLFCSEELLHEVTHSFHGICSLQRHIWRKWNITVFVPQSLVLAARSHYLQWVKSLKASSEQVDHFFLMTVNEWHRASFSHFKWSLWVCRKKEKKRQKVFTSTFDT